MELSKGGLFAHRQYPRNHLRTLCIHDLRKLEHHPLQQWVQEVQEGCTPHLRLKISAFEDVLGVTNCLCALRPCGDDVLCGQAEGIADASEHEG